MNNFVTLNSLINCYKLLCIKLTWTTKFYRKLKNCQKIGEGVYGEVFLFKNPDDPSNPSVIKIIPVEGDKIINGDRQKKYEEIVSEIIIAT
jgi:hypothetical protein